MKIVTIVAALAMTLAGCTHAPTATPPPVLRILHRPVLTLGQPVSWQPEAGFLKPAGDTSNVIIPRTALTALGGLTGVFVVNHRHVARFRLVKTGKILGKRVEILSGLDGRETLVIGNLDDVHDGSPIAVEDRR